MRTNAIDDAIEQSDGVLRWYENIRGQEAICTFYGRHLRNVLLARPAYFAAKPRLKYVTHTLRLVKPAKQEKSA